MHTNALAPFIITTILSVAIVGCESSDEGQYSVPVAQGGSSQSEQTTAQPATQSSAQPAAQPATTKSSEQQPASQDQPAAAENVPAVGDAVGYGSLGWRYGGVSCGGAQQTSATIKGLKVSGNSLSFSWGGDDLSSWGLSKDDASGAYACLFVMTSSGSWVGGKFDWISTSRTSRSLENVLSGYEGWSLANVPNPCQAAFVIVSSDKKKRTNVISTTWNR